MASSNVPFWYGIIDNNTVHLYVLVYADLADITEILPPIGQIRNYQVSFGTGQTNPSKHFTFPKDDFDTIRIYFNFNGSPKKVEIVIADLDTTNNQTLPSGNPAMDVPYVYTSMVQGTTNEFRAEMVVKVSQGKTFSHSKSDPNGLKNSFSNILSSGSGTQTEFNQIHEFTLANASAQPGEHTLSYNGGRKGKTKNKNHTLIPFPHIKKKPKNLDF